MKPNFEKKSASHSHNEGPSSVSTLGFIMGSYITARLYSESLPSKKEFDAIRGVMPEKCDPFLKKMDHLYDQSVKSKQCLSRKANGSFIFQKFNKHKKYQRAKPWVALFGMSTMAWYKREHFYHQAKQTINKGQALASQTATNMNNAAEVLENNNFNEHFETTNTFSM